ncbi:unnamed protein product [Malus baccata var. baccata]
MFHSLPLSLVPCLFSSSVTLTQRSRASSLSRSVSLIPCLFSSSVTLTHGGATLFPYPSSLYSGVWTLSPSFPTPPLFRFVFFLHSDLQVACYGLMCCRQCFRSNAKEIGFIKISIQTSTSAGLEQTLPWIFYHKVIGVTNFFLFVEGKIASPKVSKVLETVPVRSRKKKKKKKTETEPKKTEKNLGRTEPNRNFGLVLVLAKNRTETNRTQP